MCEIHDITKVLSARRQRRIDAEKALRSVGLLSVDEELIQLADETSPASDYTGDFDPPPEAA